jgi:hypothetical protein
MCARSCSETLHAGSNLEYIRFKLIQNTWIDVIDFIFDAAPQKNTNGDTSDDQGTWSFQS